MAVYNTTQLHSWVCCRYSSVPCEVFLPAWADPAALPTLEGGTESWNPVSCVVVCCLVLLWLTGWPLLLPFPVSWRNALYKNLPLSFYCFSFPLSSQLLVDAMLILFWQPVLETLQRILLMLGMKGTLKKEWDISYRVQIFVSLVLQVSMVIIVEYHKCAWYFTCK